MTGSPSRERVLRRSLHEIRWGFLVPPDVESAERDLSRRVRRQLQEEARGVDPPAGYRSRIERVGVRHRTRVERPWYGLGILVRCTLEAAAKLRLTLEPDSDPDGRGSAREHRRRSRRRRAG